MCSPEDFARKLCIGSCQQSVVVWLPLRSICTLLIKQRVGDQQLVAACKPLGIYLYVVNKLCLFDTLAE